MNLNCMLTTCLFFPYQFILLKMLSCSPLQNIPISPGMPRNSHGQAIADLPGTPETAPENVIVRAKVPPLIDLGPVQEVRVRAEMPRHDVEAEHAGGGQAHAGDRLVISGTTTVLFIRRKWRDQQVINRLLQYIVI